MFRDMEGYRPEPHSLAEFFYWHRNNYPHDLSMVKTFSLVNPIILSYAGISFFFSIETRMSFFLPCNCDVSIQVTDC